MIENFQEDEPIRVGHRICVLKPNNEWPGQSRRVFKSSWWIMLTGKLKILLSELLRVFVVLLLTALGWVFK